MTDGATSFVHQEVEEPARGPRERAITPRESRVTYICMQATPQDIELRQVPRRMHPHEPTMFTSENALASAPGGRAPSMILAGGVHAQSVHGIRPIWAPLTGLRRRTVPDRES